MITAKHAREALETLGDLQRELFSRGNEYYRRVGREAVRTAGMNGFLWNRMVEGGLVPAISSLAGMQDQIADSWVKVATGRRSLGDHLREMGERTSAGLRYSKLITTLGKQLFGSATFPGEQVLAENELFTLSYLPPVAQGPGPRPPALFHVGGFLPFGDGIFRMLPETNLFLPFLQRGIPIYALELRKAERRPSETLTLERFLEIIDETSETAFRHNGEQRMMIEGYCGLAMPALSYLCAMPERAERKFKVAFTMVGPVDGRRCAVLNDMMERTPDYAIQVGQAIASLNGGYVSGESMQRGIDIPFASFFWKTPLGRFVVGWQRRELAAVDSLDELGFAARRELAGAYWISPENSRETPIPASIVRFSTRLWTHGIDPDGGIPFRFRGEKLSLATLRDRTSIEVVGFYGAKDRIVPPETAQILVDLLRDRYTHVVHQGVGHIGYVLSPEVWDPSHQRALTPNPIDVVLAAYQR
jgi:hypothetical protein